MMKDSARPHDLYTPLAEHTLVDVCPNNANDTNSSHFVTLLNQKTGTTRRYEVSLCVILIGSRPDLRLLNKIAQPTVPCSTPTPIHPNLQHHLLVQKPTSKEEGATLFEQLTGINIFDLPNHRSDTNDEHWLLGRKMAWLKNLCLKCRSVNMCELSRRNEYRKLCVQYMDKTCKSPKPSVTTTPVEQEETQDVNDDDHIFALQLGEDPLKPIDCKTNPIAVNKYTNEVQRTARGLYAMGPLVGDNFVRFISGGALAITSALHREND